MMTNITNIISPENTKQKKGRYKFKLYKTVMSDIYFIRMRCFVSVLATLMIFAGSKACYPPPTPPPPPSCPLEQQTCVSMTNVLAKKTVSAPLPLRCSKIH